MPIQDWRRVIAGVFHDFHNSWITHLKETLNGGVLPEGFYAFSEQQTGRIQPDVYAKKRKTITIRHRSGDEVVALIEIVSPANKDRERSVREFVDKAYASLTAGLHLLLIELFPPGKFDPLGIHGAIWLDFAGGPSYQVPHDKPLVLASYEAGEDACAYVQPTAVGATLIEMPLFLQPGRYVNVPLETTYMSAFAGVPQRWKAEVQAP
jgi:hypothetical protein